MANTPQNSGTITTQVNGNTWVIVAAPVNNLFTATCGNQVVRGTGLLQVVTAIGKIAQYSQANVAC
jgi:hypothetical protein